MAWTEITRPRYERDCARYASDLTDNEWALIEPLTPAAKRIGRPRKTSLREVVNALLYIASSGCAWRLLPKEFPPFSTVQKYFYWWRDDGLLERISHGLVALAREALGRDAQPTAGVIDSQSVKTTESGAVSGYDGGKKIKGRKRHILTDTNGFLLAALVTPPTFKIATARRPFSPKRAIVFHGCAMSSPTAVMRSNNCARR